MKLPAEQRAIEAAFDEYRQWLDRIPDEQFEATPPGGGWSYAEVYSHILQADRSSFMAVDQCINGNGRDGRVTLVGRYTLLTGKLPPVRTQVPKEAGAASQAKKINKEEARNLLIKCRKRLAEVMARIEKAPKHSRIHHPRMGMLNAGQWLKFIRIHSEHHLHQLQRIENKFSRP